MSILSNYLPRGIVPVSNVLLTETTTVNYSQNVLVLLMLVGAGGSGGCWAQGNTGSIGDEQKVHAQGGNAGGVVFQLVRLQAGVNYTLTPGTGGPAVGDLSKVIAGAEYTGTPGGDTTFAGGTLPTITANGGLGGRAWRIATGTTSSHDFDYQTQTWGSNADLIFPGGYGGKITLATTLGTSTSQGIFTGGGAANVYGLDQELVSGGLFSNIFCGDFITRLNVATGGGGVSGRGGDVYPIATVARDVLQIASGGGGAAGRAPLMTPTPVGDDEDHDGLGGAATGFSPGVLISLTGQGGDGLTGDQNEDTGNNGEDGAGGGGFALDHDENESPIYGGDGGIFGGGAACTDSPNIGTTGQPDAIYGGEGGLGGGGGAAGTGCERYGDAGALSGPGGDGFGMIFLLSDFGKVIA